LWFTFNKGRCRRDKRSASDCEPEANRGNYAREPGLEVSAPAAPCITTSISPAGGPGYPVDFAATALTPRFEDQVEGRFRCAVKVREAGAAEYFGQNRLAGLRTQHSAAAL
jgi:hypothetical protein